MSDGVSKKRASSWQPRSSDRLEEVAEIIVSRGCVRGYYDRKGEC